MMVSDFAPPGRLAVALLAAAFLASCSDIPGSGPSTSDIVAASAPAKTGERRFALVDVDANTVSRMKHWSSATMKGTFGSMGPARVQAIGVGDFVSVTIWEAGGGTLFAPPPNTDQRAQQGARPASIPEQVVGSDGAITVPFAGRVQVIGRSPQQVEAAIVSSLSGKATDPQALVTVTRNIANTVTVMGEVTGGARVPLTMRGDRILDAVATAGGTKVPAHEIFVTLQRSGRTVRIPMQAILTNPAENIYVQPGDVLSLSREPQTFTAAGATGKNAVVPFEAVGITLDQAIAQAGGLSDSRADPAGVFVIRYERPEDYDKLGLQRPSAGPMESVPVIYRVNMRTAEAFFLSHQFPIRHKDILFVSNAPLVEFQKVAQAILPFVGLGATVVGVIAVSK